MSGASVRIAVLGRGRLVREAFVEFLAGRPGFAVVGHTADLADLTVLCRLRRPNAILVDLTGPAGRPARGGRAGPNRETRNALRMLRERFPSLAVVALVDDEAAVVGIQTSGYGVSDLGSEPSTQRAREGRLLPVTAGGVISAALPGSAGLVDLSGVLRQQVAAAHAVPGRDGLTDRELEVIRLINRGHGVPEIASRLELSPRTVENYKRRIYRKLGVRSQSHAAARAFALGISDGPQDPVPECTCTHLLPEISPREHDILQSIARGNSVRETARDLGITSKTVENTQTRLFRKLGVRNRVNALTAARRLGLLDPLSG
jgi:DNA-binding NarL/FixJ family response regulator